MATIKMNKRIICNGKAEEDMEEAEEKEEVEEEMEGGVLRGPWGS